MNILEVMKQLRIAKQAVSLHEGKGISNGVTTAIDEVIKLLNAMLREAIEPDDFL